MVRTEIYLGKISGLVRRKRLFDFQCVVPH